MFVSQGIVFVLGKYAEEAALRRGGGVHARPRADVSAGTSAGTSGGVSGDAHTAHTRSLNTASLAPRGGHHNTGALPRDILPLLIMLGLAACSANDEELDRCEDYDVNAATKTGNDGAHPAPQDDAFVMADRVARADACVDGWVQISGKVAKSGFDDVWQMTLVLAGRYSGVVWRQTLRQNPPHITIKRSQPQRSQPPRGLDPKGPSKRHCRAAATRTGGAADAAHGPRDGPRDS